jgi:hypothetical protein
MTAYILAALAVAAAVAVGSAGRAPTQAGRVPVYIYIHVCCLGEYKAIFRHLLASIQGSSIYDAVYGAAF